MNDTPDFRLNPAIDTERMRADFAASGRVRIAPFLVEADARRLAEHLRARPDWTLVLNSGAKLFELNECAQAAMDTHKREQLDSAVYEAARTGFQYRYDSIRVSDLCGERMARGSLLDRFAEFLSGEAAQALLRRITGADEILFADAQATRYRPGHFLTEHDDGVPGKHRKAAYVFGLTEEWRTDWGGLLLFHGQAGEIAHGFAPRFNTLSLFAVPQPHSVSLVSPAAGAARISITGWLRTVRPQA